jgi:hypothetical protein
VDGPRDLPLRIVSSSSLLPPFELLFRLCLRPSVGSFFLVFRLVFRLRPSLAFVFTSRLGIPVSTFSSLRLSSLSIRSPSPSPSPRLPRADSGRVARERLEIGLFGRRSLHVDAMIQFKNLEGLVLAVQRETFLTRCNSNVGTDCRVLRRSSRFLDRFHRLDETFP